jgi:hypothetical protein
MLPETSHPHLAPLPAGSCELLNEIAPGGVPGKSRTVAELSVPPICHAETRQDPDQSRLMATARKFRSTVASFRLGG